MFTSCIQCQRLAALGLSDTVYDKQSLTLALPATAIPYFSQHSADIQAALAHYELELRSTPTFGNGILASLLTRLLGTLAGFLVPQGGTTGGTTPTPDPNGTSVLTGAFTDFVTKVLGPYLATLPGGALWGPFVVQFASTLLPQIIQGILTGLTTIVPPNTTGGTPAVNPVPLPNGFTPY